MPAVPLPSGLVTFCFTDVEGSTRLFHELGDAWPVLLDEHNAIVRAVTAAHGGAEVKTEGDAFFLAFSDAAAAVAACADVQRELRAHPWPAGARLRVRMGLHTDEAQPVGDDYVAIAVHRAARIVGAAHGGQVLASAETAAAAADRLGLLGLRELGAYRLKDFDQPQRLFQLVGPGLGDEFPQLRVPPAARHNLPRQRTSFVGREQTLVELADLVPRSPLLTIVATGGAGKTRLAVEVATRLVPSYDDGVWFVDLAGTTRPSLVAPAVAGALGLVEVAGVDPVELVVDHLADRSALLVLDNCEQVVDAAAALVDAVLARAPGVHVIATSREALRVRGEQLWPLAPLSQPDDADDLRTSESGRLFVERARLDRPDYTPEPPETVVRLLRSLDGLPLAIELAAARVATMAVGEVVAQLDRRLDLLVGGARGDAPRQRTLRATVAWSYGLLGADEQAVFARLSVFRGGFTRDAAVEVSAYGGLDPLAVSACLDALVAKSLVQLRDGRFRLLEALQAYALEVLGHDREAAERHRGWVLRTLDLSGLATGTAAHADALDAIELEHDNVRAAEERADEDSALRLATGAAELRFLRGHVEEGRAALRRALASPAGDGALRARAAATLGYHLVQSDGVGGEAHDLLVGAVGSGDDEAVLVALLALGVEHRFRDEPVEAARLFDEARRTAARTGDRSREVLALIYRSYLDDDLGRYDDAIAEATEAHALATAAGDRRQTAIALHSRSLSRFSVGDVDGSDADADAANASFRLLGDLRSQALCDAALAACARAKGDHLAAAAHLGHAVRLIREIRAAALLPEVLLQLAALVAGEQPARAAELLGASDAARGAAGFEGPGSPEERLLRDTLRVRLGDDHERLVRVGGAGGLDRWLDLAEETADQVRPGR